MFTCLLDYSSAINSYSKGLELYSKLCNQGQGSCDHEIAVCYANRAACHMKKVCIIRGPEEAIFLAATPIFHYTR